MINMMIERNVKLTRNDLQRLLKGIANVAWTFYQRLEKQTTLLFYYVKV